MRLAVLAFVLLSSASVGAQVEVRTVGGDGARAVALTAGGTVALGPVALDVPDAAVRTVGLETAADGTAALSVWLGGAALARLATVTRALVGRSVVVVVDGEALAVTRVDGEVANGLVLVPSLPAADAARVAVTLRRRADDRPPRRRTAFR